jgi:hypothetical protein
MGITPYRRAIESSPQPIQPQNAPARYNRIGITT